ncbi:MarR family transcriptional regulator [Lactobacillus sp. LC28-10]|uniref:MarR family transcriptional regulator n=1 Tax=Secundilactobacillus angelensis TaxID=2722706 RepID=A0ABX1L159_9LACO|nr:MarR family transcriptional regulator [Secundilactobacillus angelensis]MCH5463236.1 MarR family transcriptional regulator [Secundilactobacillus angelensis]NLR19164.1 MarR family transcriptional regulator [Secundilactobacillus angelensis]
MSNTTPRRLDDQLCFAFYSASKKFNHFYQDALKPFHLTYPQYITLLALWETSPMTVRELGSHLNLDSGTLTPLLKRLEKQGWISRERSDQDERQVNVSVTEYAVEKRDEVYERVNDCINLMSFNGVDYHQLIDQIHQVMSELDDISDKDLIQEA